MSQSLLRDRGHRVVEAGTSSGSDSSRVEDRARRSDAGAWSEDLGVQVYGADAWTIPGKGDSESRCGDYYPEGVCSECGELHVGTHSCGRRECPDCWGLWARDAAMRATVRLQSFRYTQPDDWHRQVVHATYSPSEGSIQSVRDYREMVKRAYDVAREKGMRGGVAVPHGYRATDETKEIWEAVADEFDYGMWTWIRSNDVDWSEQTYWSPHVHIIGATTPDMEPGDDDGEVWKVIRSFERFGVRDESSYEDVYGAVRYLLSHATFHTDERMQVVRWWGCLANNAYTEAERPSDGVMSVVERTTEEVAGRSLDDEDDGEETAVEDDTEAEIGECRAEGCDGTVIDVFAVPEYIRQAEPPPDIRDRMQAAYEWRMGRVSPPPGLKRPQSREDALEAFEAML